MTPETKLSDHRRWPLFVLFLIIAVIFFLTHSESAEIKVLFRENIADPNPKDKLYLVHKTYWGLKHEPYEMRLSPDGEWEFKTHSGAWWGFNGSQFGYMVEMNLERYDLPGDRQ